MIVEIPLSTEGQTVRVFRYFPRFSPRVSSNLTGPFIRLEHIFFPTKETMSVTSGETSFLTVYSINGSFKIESSDAQKILTKTGVAEVLLNENRTVRITPVGEDKNSDMIAFWTRTDDQIENREIRVVGPTDIPNYEEDGIVERRISGQWSALGDVDHASASLLFFREHASVSSSKPPGRSIILVLEGWIKTDEGPVMKDQLLIPEKTGTIDCRKGTTILFLRSSGDHNAIT